MQPGNTRTADVDVVLAAGSMAGDADFKVARDKAFRKARRHTFLVRALRLVLPVAAVGLLASYGVFMRQTYRVEVGKGELSFGSVAISTEALKAYDPKYEGFNKDGGRYVFAAKSAEQDFRQTGPIKLETIDGRLIDAASSATRLKAVRGDYFDKTGVLELYERIDVDTDSGMTAKLTRASVDTKQSRIESMEPVTVDMPGSQVRGQRMVLEQKKRLVVFDGGVQTRLTQDESKARTPRPEGASGLVTGTGPIDIVSRQLTVDDIGKTALFAGEVVAKQGEATLSTPELEVVYEGNATAPGASAAAPAGAPAASANRVKVIRARRDVVMVSGTQRATGSGAEFDQVEDTMRLQGPVEISQEPDRKATGDDAFVENKRDTVLLTGASVVVTQARNVLRGRRLFVNRKIGTMQMTSPASAGVPAGRVSARLYSGDAEQPASAARKRPAPAPAAKDSGLMPNFQRDPNEPIDIEAVTLDVDDRVKTAVFRGDVVAVQGLYTIRTPELVAMYTGDSSISFTNGTAPSASAAAADKKPGSELRRVEARTRVAITSKDGQSATGSFAVFDPKTNIATLTGDVTVTREGAIVRGPKATIDMNTGIFNVAQADPGASAATSNTSFKGRPALLFYPDQAKEAAKKAVKKDATAATPPAAKDAAVPAAAAQPKASSWSAETKAAPAPRSAPVQSPVDRD